MLRKLTLAVAVVAAVALRLWTAQRGYNDDTLTVFEIAHMPLGANFYQELPYRANWGPIAYWFFQIFERLPRGDFIHSYRIYLSVFFTAFDLVTAFILYRLWNATAALIFLFSPVAVIIAGYHCNAEPALVATALIGLYIYETRKAVDQIPAGLHIAIGVSLAWKHSFVLLPLWLAMRPVPWKERVRGLALTYSTWLLLVAYYLFPSPQYFADNVLRYSSWSGNALIPSAVTALVDVLGVDFIYAEIRVLWLPLFLAMFLAFGFTIRRLPIRQIFLFYPLALLSFTSAVALQYFDLSMYSLAVGPNAPVWIFHAVSGYEFAGHEDELGMFSLPAAFTSQFKAQGEFYYNQAWWILQALLLWILVDRWRSVRRGLPAHTH